MTKTLKELQITEQKAWETARAIDWVEYNPECVTQSAARVKWETAWIKWRAECVAIDSIIEESIKE